jgi:hypothetical protein
MSIFRRVVRLGAIVVGMLVLAGLVAPLADAATPSNNPTPRAVGHVATNLPPGVHPASPPLVPLPQSVPAPKKPTPAPIPASTAMAQARASGKPVAVTAETTDTTDVVANPNGSFTMHSSLLPVRTQRDGQWVSIDPTLHANADGTYSPAATADGVVFSGGGTTPLVTLTHGADTLSLSWPAALPTPAVSGPTATYRNVLPGVDLRLTATSTDYREVLVVRDATAAANPALAAIQLTTAAHGLTVHTDEYGLLTATDAHGTDVFHGATPVMWDSTVDPSAGPAPSATDPGTGHVSPLTVHTAATANGAHAMVGGGGATSTAQVTVVPDPAALAGPHVTYPLYIDPEMSSGSANWAEVTGNGWHYYDPAQLAQVGLCTGWSGCNGLTVARSYFEMPTGPLDNGAATATIWSAHFFLDEVWASAGCGTAEPVQIDEAGPISGGTVWPGPDGRGLDTVSSAGSSGCEADIPPANVASAAQDAASGHWPTLTLAMKSPNEGDKYQWKKFVVGAGSPTLDITYSYPPNAAYGLGVANAVNCNGTTYAPDGPTTLVAAATDNNNPPLNPGLTFEVSNNNFTGGDVTGNINGPVRIASGTTGSWTAPGNLAPGDYQYRVSVDNDPGAGDDLWAGGNNTRTYTTGAFTRLAAPTSAPVIATGQYPGGSWGEPADNPGSFGFNAAGAPNVAGITWTLDGAGTESVPATTQCDYNQTFTGPNGVTGGYLSTDATSFAAVNLPAGLSVGYHTMYARSFDFAHNLSPESTAYTFYVAAPLGVAANAWQEAEKTTLSQPAGQNDTVGTQQNCCGVSWSGGAQVLWDGTAAGQSLTMSFTVPTSMNYEIAIALTTANDYGVLSFTVDGTPVRVNGQPTFDAYTVPVATAFASLGTTYLKAGTNTITVTAVGTNPKTIGNRYQAGIDGFEVQATDQLDAQSSMAVTAADLSGAVKPTVQPNDGVVYWPGGAQLSYPATATGQALKLSFQVPFEADYGLGVGLTQSSNAGQLKFTVDGSQVLANTAAAPFDAYNAAERYYYLPLGGVHLLGGTHSITITVVGRNAASAGFGFGVGQITDAEVSNVTAGSFSQAMNNHGIAPDHAVGGANFDGGNVLSSNALASVGLTSGSKFTTGGVTFTMPTLNGGNDNVVADGQTIPLPQGTDSAIGMLVASTCNWSPEVPAAITYTDHSVTNPLVPTVPDWIYGQSATVTLPYAADGSGNPFNDRQAHLYAVFLPTDPTRTVQSITLPYTGSTMELYGCGGGDPQPSLHVFAIAPRPVSPAPTGGGTWLGAWSAPTDAAALPPGGTLAGRTVRTVVHPSTTGSAVRIRLSDVDAMAPVTVDAATVAAQAGTTGTGPAALAAPVALTFGGTGGVTIPAGGEVNSDAVAFPATAGGSGNLLVSLHVSVSPTQVPTHGTTTNATYLGSGNATTNTDGSPFGTPVPGDYFLTGVDVASTATAVGTIAVLGDQTSVAGASGGQCGGGTAYACTWADDLAATGGSKVPGSIVNVSRAGTLPQDQWRLNDGSGTTAADPIGGHPATAAGGVTWGSGWSGQQNGSMNFNGTNGSVATSGPVLNTQQSFTVSAWVNPQSLGTAYQTFVVQQAGTAGGLYLEYDPGTHDWAFSRAETDTVNPTVDRAESTSPAQAGTWTQLVGTFDVATGTMSLYVNGGLSSSIVDNFPLASNGPLDIGHGFFNGAANNFVNGGVANVQVFGRSLNPLDVNELYDSQGSQQPAEGIGAPSAYNTGITVGTFSAALATSPATQLAQLLAGEPNLRTVIVSLGANDVLNAESPDLIVQNIGTIIRRNRALGLSNLLRPDGNQIQVVLTTIPPLGLAQSDQREKNREQVNADIAANYGDYGANGFVDFDKAVSDTTPGLVAPGLLTNGQPNATYYRDLAAAILAALKFPPTIQL